MDYLDVKKERQHNILLMCGYVLIAAAITIATLVLLYQAYGFGLGKNGTVVQNGLVFFSSQPNPANIWTNDQRRPETTNTRMTLPAGIYDIRLTRDGYHDWRRKIEVEGGGVQHFDYPFLVPTRLDTRNLETFDTQPGLLSQSQDRRWLVLQPAASLTNLAVYDLRNPDDPPEPLNLPVGLLSESADPGKWQPVEWADNNQHFLLKRTYDGRSEFILVNRTEPAESVNLNRTLGVNPVELELKNRKFDRYLAYDAAQTLRSLRLEGSAEEPVYERILAYKSYGNETLLFVTDNGAPAGKVLVKLTDGVKTWNIRQFSTGSNYMVDLTKYSDDMYVVAASSNDNKVYVYRDPAGQLNNTQIKAPGPMQVMHLAGVNHISFSSSAQFVAAQKDNRYAVYDLENRTGYNYVTAEAVDAPEIYARWMDGNRLMHVSSGQLNIYDYDYANKRILGKASPAYKPAFAPDYEQVYLVTQLDNGRFALTETALLTAADR